MFKFLESLFLKKKEEKDIIFYKKQFENFKKEESERKKLKYDLFLDKYQEEIKNKEYGEGIMKGKNNEFNILEKKNIFTKYELIFFNELKNLIKNTNYNIFSKIRIADIVKSKNNIEYSEFIKIFNKINRKHIDFLISDNYGNILVLIELDGYSHNYKKTQESDEIKNKLFSTLNIPFLRFKNGYSHNLENLKSLLF